MRETPSREHLRAVQTPQSFAFPALLDAHRRAAEADLHAFTDDGALAEWAGLPVEPVVPGGHDHRTFRLGSELSVRLPSAEGYAQQVAKEQRWLPELAPLLPLEVPSPVARGVPGEGYPFEWSVYRWLEGAPASAGPVRDPVADQLLREALLTTASDWAFMVSKDSAAEYARTRAWTHAHAVREIAGAAPWDAAGLAARWRRADGPFAALDARTLPAAGFA